MSMSLRMIRRIRETNTPNFTDDRKARQPYNKIGINDRKYMEEAVEGRHSRVTHPITTLTVQPATCRYLLHTQACTEGLEETLRFPSVITPKCDTISLRLPSSLGKIAFSCALNLLILSHDC